MKNKEYISLHEREMEVYKHTGKQYRRMAFYVGASDREDRQGSVCISNR